MSESMSRGLLLGALLTLLAPRGGPPTPIEGRHDPMPREPWTRWYWSPYWFDHGGGYMQIHQFYYSQNRIMASLRMLIMNMHMSAENLLRKVDYIQEWTYVGNETLLVDRILSIQMYYLRLVNTFLRAAKLMPFHVVGFVFMYKHMITVRRMYMELDNQIQVVVEHEMMDPGGWKYGRRAGGGRAGGPQAATRRRQQRYYTRDHARGQRQFW